MSVDLTDYVDTLRREVTPPGSQVFITVSDDQMVGYLADAFWEVKLDGFLEPYSCDSAGIVLPLNDSQVTTGKSFYTPSAFDPNRDIPREDIALICLYAGIKILRNQLINQSTRITAKAGPVEFTQENSANVLTSMLKQLDEVKNRLLYFKSQDLYGNVTLLDAFSARSISGASYAGYVYDWFVGAFGSELADIEGSYDSYGIL